MAIDEQVRAYGGPQLQLTRQVMERFSGAIEAARIDVVPRVLIQNGGANGAPGSQGNVFEALLALMLSDKLAARSDGTAPRDARLDHARDAIRDSLVGTLAGGGG